MSKCVTHHEACACREAEFAALKAELVSRREALIRSNAEMLEWRTTAQKYREEVFRLEASGTVQQRMRLAQEVESLKTSHELLLRALKDIWNHAGKWSSGSMPGLFAMCRAMGKVHEMADDALRSVDTAPCPECKGTGEPTRKHSDLAKRCEDCGGSGRGVDTAPGRSDSEDKPEGEGKKDV